MTDTSPSYLDDGDKPNRPGQGKPGTSEPEAGQEGGLPPAGPHDRKDLIDEDKTPGAGTVPPEEDDDVSAPTG